MGLWSSVDTGNLSVSSSKYANGRTAIEIVIGDTPDISEYLDFGFYYWVTYRADAGLGENSLGRWLGVSHKIGPLMPYWIITVSGVVISCTNVDRLTNMEQKTEEWKERMDEYTSKLNGKLDIKDAAVQLGHESNNWN